MDVKDEISAKEIVAGAVKPEKVARLKLFKVRLVKERTLAFPVTEITSAESLAKIARSELGHLVHEEIIAIGLSVKNGVIGVVKVGQGGLGGAGVTPADVIRPLVAMGAVKFVLAHNHPSGDPMPSGPDIELTANLKKAAECVGLTFLDHLIIGSIRAGARWESLRALGIM